MFKKSVTEGAAENVRAADPPGRRAGTFTLGLTLVAGGGAMLASLFWPALPMDRALRLTPCILISLGVEVLLAARGGRKVRYDWMGMFLCFILTIFAIGLYGAAWWMAEGPGIPVYNGSWRGGSDGLSIQYSYFNDSRSHWMELAAGDILDINCSNQEGQLNVEIYSIEDGEVCFGRSLTSEKDLQVEAPTTGEYCISLYGRKASGCASFTRIPGPNAAELDQTEDTDGGSLPEEGGPSADAAEPPVEALPPEEVPAA